MQKRILAIISVLLMVVTLMTGCAEKNTAKDEKKFATLSDFSGETIDFTSGSSLDKDLKEILPDYETRWMKSASDATEDVKAGKAAAFVTDFPLAKKIAGMNSELAVFPQLAFEEEYAWCFPKGSKYLEDFNKSLAQLREDGTIDEIDKYWIDSNSPELTLEPQKSSGENGTIKIGCSGDMEPLAYINGNGDFIGRDIAVCNAVCDILGLKAEYVLAPVDTLAEAINSGKVDLFCGSISVTEERKEMMDFCDTTYSGGAALVVKKDRIADETTSSADDLDIDEKIANANIGVMLGSTAVKFLGENYPDATISEFDSIGDAVEALKANKIDYVMTAYSTAKNFERYNSELYVPDKIMKNEDISMAVQKGNTELLNRLDELLDKYQESGLMDEILENWIRTDGTEAPYDTSSIPLDTNTPVLKVGIAANREPMCFVSGDKCLGVDCELIERMAYDMGMHVEYMDMKFSSLIPALQSGKVDVIISNISLTEERAQVVDFTDPYFDNPQVLIMRKTDSGVGAVSDSESNEGFFDKLKSSFIRTFVTENRWKLILNGLGVTILISLLAFVIGSLWGAVICMGLRSSKKIASVPARAYVRLLQGTPIVVLLMILYYVVFKSVDISAIIVAVIGFSLNLGAYTSEIFRTAIDSVDKGQIEAAYAIGFNKFKVFTKIIFPQAARNALPVYKGEFISLVKSTSVVGYIAIQDLTKVSDIIRSRTYEAFFPLITTALIYFLVTYIFIVILNMVEKKIDPKRRKRTLKGVDIK